MKHLKDLFTLLAVLLFPGTAFAQQQGNTIERRGFVFGVGIGGGIISIGGNNEEVPFSDAQFSFSLPNLKLGWMVNDRLAILATLPGMIYDYEGRDRSFEAIIPALQYWVKDRWWVNGGVGLAMDFPAFYEVDDFKEEDWNFGCAVSVSTGYELLQKKRFALYLQTKLHMGRVFMENDGHRDGVAFSIGLGFNWY